MNEDMVFKQLDFYRHLTLLLLDSLNERTADAMPSGFNNSIRWNLGHIYVSHENIALRLAGEDMLLPDNFSDLFAGGTKPSEWKASPPSLNELKQHLSLQAKRIKKILQGKLDHPTAMQFTIPGVVEFNTIGETLNFALYHEGQHTGFIKALKRTLSS